jgi:predicted permease
MQTFAQDLKYALRLFRESPGFTITAVAALTLGIGVNVAIFSVVNAVLLKPVPFPEPDRLVFIVNSRDGNPGGAAASPAKFMHYRAQTEVLEDVAAFNTTTFNHTDGDVPVQIEANRVSEAYFRLFRAPFVSGRGFLPDEDLPGGPKVAVISYNFWTQRLGGDPDIVGKTISLSEDAYTVVGVVSREYDIREFANPELWVPFQFDPNTTDQGHYFQAAARLKPGVTLEQARARLEASAAQYRERFPIALDENQGFSALTMQDSVVRGARGMLLILFGAVAFVLLIACANVANLLLVRATGRRREIAVRSALGAGRWRIVRQLLTESVLLSMAGGILGLVLGFFGMRALLAVNTAGLPRLGDGGTLMGMDWRVVTFTLALSLVTGILFGLVPALASARTDLSTVIKDASGRSGSGFRQNKTRSVLVTVEVALAVVLLIGASLLIRTSLALGRVDPGFNVENVIAMRTSLAGERFATTASVDLTARNALERIRSIPGVADAVATCCVPLQGGYGLPFNVIGRTNEGPFSGGGGIVFTTAGYFGAFDVPIRRGRVFTDRDTGAAPPVVVINEAMAKEFWPEGDPLADRILIGGGSANMKELTDEPIRQVIGIVSDVRANGIAREPGPTMYIPHAQMPDALHALMLATGPMAWVVRTEREPGLLSAPIQEALRESTGLPVTDVQLMREIVSIDTSRQRLNMLLMSIFGGSALLLAAIGVYGLMAYSVQHRTQEIGIRMALGAEAARVKRMVVRQGMLLVSIGLVIGLGAAFYLARLLGAVLFEVKPYDPTVFVAVPVMLALIALAAVALPAQRASRVAPLEALRYE